MLRQSIEHSREQAPHRSKNLLMLVILLLAVATASCTTKTNIAYGKVLERHKIDAKDYRPGRTTMAGGGIGGGIGAGVGAVAGGLVGATVTIATFGLMAPAIPGLIAGGAVAGGGVGAAVGGGAGYISGVYEQGQGLYQFSIKSNNQEQPFSVVQYMRSPIAVNDQVEIYHEEGNLRIRKWTPKQSK